MNTGRGDNFQNSTPVVLKLILINNKLDLMKLKNFWKVNDTVNKTKTTAYMMGKDFLLPYM